MRLASVLKRLLGLVAGVRVSEVEITEAKGEEQVLVHLARRERRRMRCPECGWATSAIWCGTITVMPDPTLLERISIDPAVCGGRPCVRGHRIWVSLVLGMLAEGMSTQEVLGEYPGLQEADVRACIAYGARLAGERYVELAPSG